MFNSSKRQNVSAHDVIDTIIGENTVLEGTINTRDTTRIDGKIKGEARSEGFLIIGEGGLVEGDVRAKSMLIAGRVKGNIYVQERLEVTESGKISGDVVTKTLIIAEGAEFEGKCNMTSGKSSEIGKSQEKEINPNEGNEKNKAADRQNPAKAQ